jgi:hypothetical protein
MTYKSLYHHEQHATFTKKDVFASQITVNLKHESIQFEVNIEILSTFNMTLNTQRFT